VLVVDFQNEQTGGFSGHGYESANAEKMWEISGDLAQNDIRMRLRVISTNENMELVGVINDDGSMVGAGEGVTWSIAGGVATREQGTHGQSVKEAEEKKDAAQERTGLPEQSKGNTNE
jgi:hypothetical protein